MLDNTLNTDEIYNDRAEWMIENLNRRFPLFSWHILDHNEVIRQQLPRFDQQGYPLFWVEATLTVVDPEGESSDAVINGHAPYTRNLDSTANELRDAVRKHLAAELMYDESMEGVNGYW